jgi:hypothetical protein
MSLTSLISITYAIYGAKLKMIWDLSFRNLKIFQDDDNKALTQGWGPSKHSVLSDYTSLMFIKPALYEVKL